MKRIFTAILVLSSMIGTLQAQSTSQLLSTLKRTAEQQNTLKTEQVWMLDSVITKDYSKTYYKFNEFGYLTDVMYYRAEWDRVDEFGEPYSDSKLVWTLVADETYYWEDENSYHIEYEFEPNGRCSYMAIYSLDEQGNKSTCIGKVETEYRDGKWVEKYYEMDEYYEGENTLTKLYKESECTYDQWDNMVYKQSYSLNANGNPYRDGLTIAEFSGPVFLIHVSGGSYDDWKDDEEIDREAFDKYCTKYFRCYFNEDGEYDYVDYYSFKIEDGIRYTWDSEQSDWVENVDGDNEVEYNPSYAQTRGIDDITFDNLQEGSNEFTVDKGLWQYQIYIDCYLSPLFDDEGNYIADTLMIGYGRAIKMFNTPSSTAPEPLAPRKLYPSIYPIPYLYMDGYTETISAIHNIMYYYNENEGKWISDYDLSKGTRLGESYTTNAQGEVLHNIYRYDDEQEEEYYVETTTYVLDDTRKMDDNYLVTQIRVEDMVFDYTYEEHPYSYFDGQVEGVDYHISTITMNGELAEQYYYTKRSYLPVVAVEEIKNIQPRGNSVIYNLQGQRISNIAAPGIYIIDGQKTYIK